MNTKTTLTVVVIAITLGVLFLIFETELFKRDSGTDEQGPPPAASAAGKSIPGLDAVKAETIKRIRIERAGEPAVVIEREGSGWVQIEPVRFPLQSFNVDRIVSDAVGLRFTSSFEPAGQKLTLQQLGLDTPRAVLTLEPREGKPITLSLGKQTAGGAAYVALDKPSDKGIVYAVGNSLHTALVDRDPRDWRTRTLASFTPSSVRSLTLKREGETLELTQKDARWVIEQPVTGRADRNAAQQLATVPTTASVREFVTDKPVDLAPFGLKEPKITLTIVTAQTTAADQPAEGQPTEPQTKETTHTLSIGNAQSLASENYFAMWGDAPVIFTLAKADVEKLRKPAGELRDPSLTPISRTDLRAIKVERAPAQPLSLAREAGAWKFGDPAPSFELAGEEVDELVAAIFDTKAQDYTPADPQKLGQPLATVSLAVVGSEQEERLTIYPAEGDKLTVVRANESTGYIVDKQSLDPVFEPLLAYRDRTALDIEKEDVVEIHIHRTGEHPAEYRVARVAPSEGEKGPGEWNLDGFDRQAFSALLDRVAPLIVDEWLAEPPVTTPEGAAIELVMKDGARHKLFIHPQSRTGRIEGMEAAFRVTQALAMAATAELRDRVALKLDADKITSVHFNSAVILRDSQGKYSIEGADLEESEAAGIFDELAGLTVERYLASGSIASLGEPAYTLTASTSDGKSHKVLLWRPSEATGQRWIARLDDREELLELTPTTASRLIAAEPPPEPEDPEK